MDYTSRPIAAQQENGSQPTLGEMLEKLLPEYVEAKRPTDNASIGETASVSSFAGATKSKQPEDSAVSYLKAFMSHQIFVLCNTAKLKHLYTAWLQKYVLTIPDSVHTHKQHCEKALCHSAIAERE